MNTEREEVGEEESAGSLGVGSQKDWSNPQARCGRAALEFFMADHANDCISWVAVSRLINTQNLC